MIRLWQLAKDAVLSFIADEALSRGAAVAFYTVTSIAPILLIVIAIAGLVFGRDAAQHAITEELSGLMGDQTAQMLQTAVVNASGKSSGLLATLIGFVTLLVTASGTFSEVQSALNAIWKTKGPRAGTTLTRVLQARAASMGLLATLGFLLVVSLAASAAVTALGARLNQTLVFGVIVISTINTLISICLITMMFAAVYKTLPDRDLEWRDVVLGAFVTAVLFVAGKSLIGWYLGSSAIASTYGAAGSLIVLLLWVYYSVQIFLLGAEFTKVFANRHGSWKDDPVPEAPKDQ